MGVAFKIMYHERAVKADIPKLTISDRDRIKRAIEKKLTVEPEIFGKPLRRSLKGYRKLRVGDYRVIFRMEKKMVKIFCVGHRTVVYKEVNKRPG